jgi:hypothetical protein
MGALPRGDCPSGRSGGRSIAAPPFHDLLLNGTPTVGSSPCVPEEPTGGAHQGLFSVTLCATTLPSRFV